MTKKQIVILLLIANEIRGLVVVATIGPALLRAAWSLHP